MDQNRFVDSVRCCRTGLPASSGISTTEQDDKKYGRIYVTYRTCAVSDQLTFSEGTYGVLRTTAGRPVEQTPVE